MFSHGVASNEERFNVSSSRIFSGRGFLNVHVPLALPFYDWPLKHHISLDPKLSDSDTFEKKLNQTL